MPSVGDSILDLGHGYLTKLSLVSAVVPPEMVQMDPPYPDTPTCLIFLKHELGYLPCYEPVEEVNAYLAEEARDLIYCGKGWWADRREVVALAPADSMTIGAGVESPTCFLHVTSSLRHLPYYFPREQAERELRRAAGGGFFGE